MKISNHSWMQFVGADGLGISASKSSNVANAETIKTYALLTTKQKWLHVVK